MQYQRERAMICLLWQKSQRSAVSSKLPPTNPVTLSSFLFELFWSRVTVRQGLTERAPLGADNHILEAPSGVKELNIYRDCYLGTNHSRNLPLAGLQETGRWGESTCLVSLRWLLLTVILKMAKMPIIRHVTNGRQGSPRVSKVQGGPQGWLRWVRTKL